MADDSEHAATGTAQEKSTLDASSLQDLSETLEQLGSWIRRATPRGGFSSAALATMAAIDRDGPQRISDLVARENLTQPGMTSVVSRLAEAGLVTRRPDPSDGRAILVSLTDGGRQYISSVHRARAAILARHVAALPAAHQRALRAATDSLRALGNHPLSAEELQS